MILPVSMSAARCAWVIGTFAASYVAVIVGHGPWGANGSDGAFISWLAVIASVPLLVGLHEVGHALGAAAVGYHVTSIHLTPEMDAMTEWDIPPGRSSAARDLLAAVAGPAVSLVASVALLLLPWEGFPGAWAAGLGTFGLLWTLDVLAPIRRQVGVERDGLAIIRLLAESRGERGNHGTRLNAVIGEVDDALLAGDSLRARQLCGDTLDAMGPDPPRPAWSALAARMALADLLAESHLRSLFVDEPPLVSEEAEPWSAEALLRAPRDPLVVATRRAVAARLRLQAPAPTAERMPTPIETRLIALMGRFVAEVPGGPKP